MSRFLGRSGEKAFSFLCSRRGVTCNQPQEDDHGWDHVVEFPHVPNPQVPADLQATLPAVFVQTKSHESDGLEVRMKLSNALKLARSSNPCFVLLASIPAGGTGVAWHALHFWSGLIERVLRRAREASRDGLPATDLHQHWFSFTMTPDDEHSEDDLLPWIQQTVREVGRDYAAAKAALHANLGFDGPRFGGTLQLGPLYSADELIDHQLGLTDSVPLMKFTMHDRRFGIEMPLPIPGFEKATAHLRANPVDTCTVRIRGPDGFAFEIEGDLIFASLPGLPMERAKARIRTPVIDIILAFSGQSSFKLHINTDERRSPAELEQVCRLISWGGEGPVDVQVSVRDERLLGAEIRVDAAPDQPGYARLALLMEPLVRVSRHLKSKVPAISIEEVHESNGIELFYSFITGTEMQANTVVPAGAVPDVDHALGFGLVAVGTWFFGALASWPIVEHERSDDRWSIKFGAPTFLQTYAFEQTDETDLACLQDDYRRYGARPGALPLDNVLVFLDRTEAALVAGRA